MKILLKMWLYFSDRWERFVDWLLRKLFMPR